ncbi:MAG: prepilin-type N-terminal cleavage/methylation domain-containing protein [Gammaproteobacteria bacterium]|nr:prepilin-type N-terminal cleavage/methylation domain-containing protein [Gammaproteobacteria bacterium]
MIAPRHRHGMHDGRFRGFTLIELMLALVAAAALATLAISSYSSYMERAKVARAEQDLTWIESRIALYQTTNDALPTSLAAIGEATLLDPWGRPYQYLDFTGLTGKGQMRKDRNLVPINSDYDLYSVGQDGATVPPILDPVSHDDVIRANNGGFVGLATDF